MKHYLLVNFLLIIALQSIGQQRYGVFFKLSNKLKNEISINLALISNINTPYKYQNARYLFTLKEPTDTIFWENENNQYVEAFNGKYKCYLEKDFESISDTIIIEIVPNTYIKDFIIIKTFEIQNGDTINKIDTNGNKQGYWTDGLKCYDNISNIKEMFYKNDLLDSLYIERYHSNSKIEKQFFYKKGQLNGVCKSYFENGQLQSEKLYKDGRLWSVVCVFSKSGEKIDFGKIENGIGVLKRYDSEKKLIDETLYKNGLPDGLSKEWYGKYYREYIFDSGNVVLEREFYEDCKTIFIETENANDFRKVKQKKYYKNGNIASIEEYKKRLKNYGEYFFENGNLKSKGEFISKVKLIYAIESEIVSYKKGAWESYSEDGKIKFIDYYIENKKVGKREIYIDNILIYPLYFR